MGLLVIGGGLAGLSAAIRVREVAPWLDVALLDKPRPVSNTQISGMRLRGGISNRRQDAAAEILELLAQRNQGDATPPMREFSRLAARELDAWHARPDFLAAEDRHEWFGPQWGLPNQAGKGHGKSVLDWLRRTAEAAGVRLVSGEAERLECPRRRVAAVVVRDAEGQALRLRADVVVLASGSAGGALFLSTNRRIRRSAHELAYEAGLSLVDSTLHMIHPFGNVARDGGPGLGCYETDRLAGVEVFAGAPVGREFLHQMSSDLLANHQAHYHFPELVREFSCFGDVVRLRFPCGRERFARVSHHYHHLGVETRDGVRARGVEGLFAVGDASGMGHWTNHRERFPGFALVKCLVDAALIAERAVPLASAGPVEHEPVAERFDEDGWPAETEDALRALNSRMLVRLWGVEAGRAATSEAWIGGVRELGDAHGWTTIAELSLAMAWAHRRALDADPAGAPEPIRINAELVRELRGSDHDELRAA
jgi:succinate dehydrogenase/fumarate reductase flavoprotein subunit